MGKTVAPVAPKPPTTSKTKAVDSRAQFAVEMRAIETVTPYAQNPRRNADAVAKVATSLHAFGWRQPIVVDSAGVVIAGHTRLLAARSLGMTTVPVHVAAGLTASQVRAYRLADNRVGTDAAWDNDLLANELRALDADMVALTGFDDDELARLLARTSEEYDPSTEWEGMPEFVHEDKTAFQSLIVHFADRSAVEQFATLVNQPITPRTRFIWFPVVVIERYADKAYAPEP